MFKKAFLFFVFVSHFAFARPIEFGPEFVFTNDLMQSQTIKPTQRTTPEAIKMMQEWSALIAGFCQESKSCLTKKGTVKGHDSIRVEFEDGFWIEVSHDPVVLEVTMKKGSTAHFKKNAKRIQSLVFDSAKQLGLVVHERIGGGHISVDYESAFEHMKLLFRNFLVDYANHAELAWGVFGNHLGNAPPMSALNRSSKEEFYQIIHQFDTDPSMTIEKLIQQIESRVYTNNPFEKSGWVGNTHYQAIRLDQVKGSSPRIEMRGFAPQKSLDDFIALCELIENRIQFLGRFKFPLELLMSKNEKMSAGEKLAKAKTWFDEMKLDWNSYKHLMLKEVQDLIPSPSLVAFNETQSDLETTREHYRGVDLLFSQMTPQGIHNLINDSKKINPERYLVPYPKMISESELTELRRGTEQRGRALMEFMRDLQGQQSFLRDGRLNPKILERILKNNDTSWEAIKMRAGSSFGFIYAPDVVRGSDGRFTILEDNIGSNTGGLGDSWQSRKDFLKLAPQFSSVLNADKAEGFPVLAKKFLQAQAGDKAVVVVYPASDYQYHKFYIAQLEKAGFIVVSDSDKSKFQIDSRTDRVLVRQIEKGKVVQQKEVGAIMIRGFSGGGFRQKYPKTVNLAVNNKVSLVGYGTFDFLGDKELSPYVEEMIEYYLKEKPILKFAQTLALSKIDPAGKNQADQSRLEEVFSRIEKWVIKDTTGLQGKGVWIGAQLNDENKAKLKKEILSRPGHYVAQEYVPVSRTNRWISDIRVHSMVFGNQATSSDVFWGRAVSVFDNGKLNTHQNAGAVPIFVNGRDTQPAIQTAMSQLFRFKDLKTTLAAYKSLQDLNDSTINKILTKWVDQNEHLFENLQDADLKKFAFDESTPESLRKMLLVAYKKKALRALDSSISAKSFLEVLKELSQVHQLKPDLKQIQQFARLNPNSEQRVQFTQLIKHPLLRKHWERQGLVTPNGEFSCRKAVNGH